MRWCRVTGEGEAERWRGEKKGGVEIGDEKGVRKGEFETAEGLVLAPAGWSRWPPGRAASAAAAGAARAAAAARRVPVGERTAEGARMGTTGGRGFVAFCWVEDGGWGGVGVPRAAGWRKRPSGPPPARVGLCVA